MSGLRAVRNVLRPALVVMRAAQARPVQARPEVQVQPAAKAKVEVCKREERGEGLFLLHHLSAALPCNAVPQPSGSALQVGRTAIAGEVLVEPVVVVVVEIH